MVEGYNFFKGTQTDINRRFLRKIEELEDRVAELENQSANSDTPSDGQT